MTWLFESGPAPARVDAAVSGVEKDRAVVLLAEPKRGANVGDPADLVEPLVRSSRLPFHHRLLYPVNDLGIRLFRLWHNPRRPHHPAERQRLPRCNASFSVRA